MIVALECIEEDLNHPMPDETLVRRCVEAALQNPHMRVSLTVCNHHTKAMCEVNDQFRDQNRVTNVLAFPMHESVDEHVYLGDILCCGEQIEREAKAQDKMLDHHWAHMLVHAVLHLQGYTHDVPEQAERMESLEVAVLASLGMPNPYQ